MKTSYFNTIRRVPALISYWRLNEKSGAEAADYANRYEVKAIYKGTVSEIGGGPLILYEENCGSAIFTGKSENKQSIEIPNIEQFNVTNFTIEAWVSIYNKEFEGCIFGKLEEATEFSAPFSLNINKSELVILVGNGKESETISSEFKLSVGVPYHLVVTREGEKVIFYVNGSIVKEDITKKEIKNGKGPFYIGNNWKENRVFAGLIGEVAFYGGVLSSNEVLYHFNLARRIVPDVSHITTFNEPTYA